MPYGDWVNELPTAFFLVVHVAAFTVGVGFAWVASKRELGVLGAGCSGGSEDAEAVAATEVRMAKSYRFDPKTIEIEAGQTVTWTNEDNFTHTVQVDGQGDHEVGQGESVSITF